MSSIDFMNEWEPGNIFKRQRSRRRWRLLQPWERDRVYLMYRANESDRELHSTIEYSKLGTRGCKRKRESTGPYIPSAKQLPNNNSTDTEIIFDGPVLYDTSDTDLAADTGPRPNLIEDLSNNHTLEINLLYCVWFALRRLMEQLQTSIQQQQNSLGGQRIAFQQLIEQLQTSIQQQHNSLDGQIAAFWQLEQAVLWFQFSLFQT